MRYIKLLLTSAIVFSLIFSILTVSSPAWAGALNETECAPAVLFLRGSDEPPVTELNGSMNYIPTQSSTEVPYIVTNGYEGPVLKGLIQGFVNLTYENSSESLTVSKVRFVGIDYPALAVFPEIDASSDLNVAGVSATLASTQIISHVIQYDSSYREGATNIVNFIQEDEKRGCETQYMLVGYSQGVISVRMAIKLLGEDSEKIVSTYVVGDPFQNPNGVTNSSQITNASTSPNSKGVGLTAVDYVIANSLLPTSWPFLPLLMSYRSDVMDADPTIYKIGDSQTQLSRVLCHQYDLVCSPGWGSSMDTHLSYFDPTKPSGQADILEVEEFDKQVRTLAGSDFFNIGERRLQGTTPVNGAATYSVANARFTPNAEDTCSWDIDSDGYWELENVECGPINATHNSEPAKITVKIVDAFGNEETQSLEQASLSEKIIQDITEIKRDTWYQFHPFSDDGKCLGFSTQNSYEPIQVGATPLIENCSTGNPDPEDMESVLATSKQSFMVKDHRATAYPGEWDEFGARIAWGYDDDYNLDSENSLDWTGLVRLYQNDQYSSHHFRPLLAKIVNGVPYYSLKHRDGQCVSVATYPTPSVNLNSECSTDSNQLFSVTEVTGDFGDLSMEKDEIAPSEVANLEATSVTYNSAEISWDAATDNRLGPVKYNIYANKPNGLESLGQVSGNSYSLQLSPSDTYEETSYTVKAVDLSGNVSNGSSVSIVTSPELSKPPAPTVELENNYNSAVINFPYDQNLDVLYAAVYKNGNFLSYVAKGNSYIDYEISPHGTYEYSYSLVSSNYYVSEVSESSTIEVENTTPPSPPTDLSVVYYTDSYVQFAWSPGIDDTDSNLSYHLYRDGVELTQDAYADEFGGYDLNPVPGTLHSYTVVAEDSFGNRSAESEPVIFMLVDDTDTTPPSQPIVTLLEKTPWSVKLSMESTDDKDIPIFDVYKDGVFFSVNYGNEFFDYNVTPGATYTYSAIAKDYSGNESISSFPLTVTVDGIPSNEPLVTSFQVEYLTHNIVNFSWVVDKPFTPGITYDVYRDDVLVAANRLLNPDSTASSDSRFSYTDFDVEPETQYTYEVVLKAQGTPSPISSPLQVITPAITAGSDTTAPSRVNLIYAFQNSEGLQFIWTKALDDSGIAAYRVYRDGILLEQMEPPLPGEEPMNFYLDTEALSHPGVTFNYQIVVVDTAGNEYLNSSPFVLTVQ